MEELSNLLQKHVSVLTAQGKTFIGTLTGVDTETLSVCLTNAKSDAGDIHKVFLNGTPLFRYPVSRNRLICRVLVRGLNGSSLGWCA